MARDCPCCGASATVANDHPVMHWFCSACHHRWREADPIAASRRYAGLSGRNARSANSQAMKVADRLADAVELAVPGSRVLEIGCAEGELGAALKLRRPVHYTGVEPSLDANDAACRLDTVIRGTSSDVQEREFDLVLSFHVLEHIDQIGAEVLRWREVVAESGCALIEVPNRMGHPLSAWDFNAEHVHYFTLSSLSALCQRAGWDIMWASTGHYESVVYPDSLRVLARPRVTEASKRERLLARFRARLTQEFTVFAIGGDFRSYVQPFLDDLPVAALFDSDPARFGTRIGAFEIGPFDLATCLGRPILIASVRFKTEIAEWLRKQGVPSDSIVGLDEVYGEPQHTTSSRRGL